MTRWTAHDTPPPTPPTPHQPTRMLRTPQVLRVPRLAAAPAATAVLLTTLGLALASADAAAQTTTTTSSSSSSSTTEVVVDPSVRQFPAAALRGTLVVTAPPQVTLDGKTDQLAPGARIWGTNRLLVLSASIVDQSLPVNYLRDSAGLLTQVWILNEAEARQKRAGATPTRNWFSFFEKQDTTPRDDGKTPFDQLPVYKP